MRRFVDDLHSTSLFIKINNSVIFLNDICLCENGKLSFLEWGKKTVFIPHNKKQTNYSIPASLSQIVDVGKKQWKSERGGWHANMS